MDLEHQILTEALQSERKLSEQKEHEIQMLRKTVTTLEMSLEEKNQGSPNNSPNGSLRYLSKSVFETKESEFQNLLRLKDEAYHGLKKE